MLLAKGKRMNKSLKSSERDDMKLKDQLKTLIESERLTISRLSKETKIPVQTLHNWIAGMEPRSLKQVRKVADYFEVSIDYLCFGIEPKSKESLGDFEEEIFAGKFDVILRRAKGDK